MPITLRPSDVAEAAVQAFSRWGETFQQIFAAEYEKERVRQVNAGLVTLEESFQKQLADYPTRVFEIYPQADKDRPTSATLAPTIKSLGQIQASDVLEDFQKSVKAQQEYINRTVRNKRAREEMLQHLAAGSVQQQYRLLGLWKKAAQSNALAGLQDLSATVMANKEYNAATKVAMIKDRTDQMLMAGWITEDEAGKYLSQMQDQAQYIEAHAGAMAATRAGGLDAGEKWLAENTPYWDGSPDTRAKVLQDVRQEWEYQGKARDEASDRVFADLHIRADTPEAVDVALGKLKNTDYFNGDQKYIWEQRFTALKANLINARTVPKGALDDWYKDNEDRMWAQLAFAKAKGIPLGSLRQMVEDAYYGRDKEGTGISKVRGAFVKAAFEYLETKEDPTFSTGIKYIESKTPGLNDKDKARVTNEFRAWMLVNPNADAKTVETAANNLVKPVVQRNIDRWGRRTWEVLWGDKRVLDEFELLSRDIEEGKYIGLAPNRQEYLARYNAYIVGLAQKDFPDENIASVFTDFTGEYGGQPGTAILVSAANNAYAYKLEGKILTLYRLAKTRAGTYTWQQVVKPETAKGAKGIEKIEKAAAAETERKGREQAGIEYARSRLPAGVPLIQEETE